MEDEASGAEWTDTGLTADSGYSYRVRSVSIHTERAVRPVRRESGWTDAVEVTTQP